MSSYREARQVDFSKAVMFFLIFLPYPMTFKVEWAVDFLRKFLLLYTPQMKVPFEIVFFITELYVKKQENNHSILFQT